ncbi:MAG TPA: transporter substrate-binding domain-containing protein [Candidatus Acidoferrales bacterium]|jgi:polar amino acid transport system substrate-binding protein|nr:transporter substrate-binding domain-containing protein [Candidatus Acidoferrales bacterium]
MIRSSRLAAVAAIVCAALLAPSAGGDAAATCSSLILTGHPSYPPVSWASGATLEGAGIDIVSKLASDSQVPMQVVHAGSWDDAQQAVKSGKADAIVGLYKTAARLPSFTYLEPAIAPDPSAVLVRTGETFVYKDWNSLIGKKGVANIGESFGHAFDTFAASKLSIATVHGNKAVYQALLSGKADYALMGYYVAASEMPADKISFATKNFATEGLYIAFSKTTPCASLAPAFSKKLAAMIADGTVKRLFAEGLAKYEASHPR